MEKSIYIMCLEKGIEVGHKGISFVEMVNHLEKNGITEASTTDFRKYFFIWFYNNFFHQAIDLDRRLGLPNNAAYMYNELHYNISKSQYFHKCPMTFEAQQHYYDYLSLIQSNNKATRANWLAIFAIFITIVLSAMQIYYANKQDRREEVSEERAKIQASFQIKELNKAWQSK